MSGESGESGEAAELSLLATNAPELEVVSEYGAEVRPEAVGRIGALAKSLSVVLAAAWVLCAVVAVPKLLGSRPDAAAASTAGFMQAQEQSECLCLFDVDRTLTGKQGMASQCNGNQEFPGVLDDAFERGDLTLSPVGAGLSSTFCGACHLGIISMGGAGGQEEKGVLAQNLGAGLPSEATWSTYPQINSPLVIGCPDPQKASCANSIVQWYASAMQTTIPASQVYFFDDHTGNTAGFAQYGFNARQVSCASREAVFGLCGAQLDEIAPVQGTVNCPA